MAARGSAARLDHYRRRRALRHALVTVEAAIAQHGEESPDTAKLEGLQRDLLAALQLTELLLGRG